MKWRICFLVLVGVWLTDGRPVRAVCLYGDCAKFGAEPSPIPNFNCGYSAVSAVFTANLSNYSFSGACIHSVSQIVVPWNATGAYVPSNGYTTENINITGVSPYRGRLGFTMTCSGLRENEDPWLTKGICSNFHPLQGTPAGEVAGQTDMLGAINQTIKSRGGPLTSSFPYDRNALLNKRDGDLAKLQADQRRAEQIRQEQLQPKSYMAQFSFPSVVAPSKGQRFFAQSVVPIKLAPPQGWIANSYVITIQRKDNRGNWVFNSNPIPVSAAEAQSATGYTGFGAGGNGAAKSPALLTAPGYWRLNAQVSAPRQSNWSDWAEFTVTAPPPLAVKGVQKGFLK